MSIGAKRRVAGARRVFPSLVNTLEQTILRISNHPRAVKREVGDMLPGFVLDDDWRVAGTHRLMLGATNVLDGFDKQVVDEDLLIVANVQHCGVVLHSTMPPSLFAKNIQRLASHSGYSDDVGDRPDLFRSRTKSSAELIPNQTNTAASG